MTTEQAHSSDARRPYAAPELTIHGSVEELTTTPNFASAKSALPTASSVPNHDQGETRVA